MTRITASQLRDDLASAINKVAFGGERLILQRNNKDVAALVPLHDLALLRRLEDKLDLEEIEKAMDESGPSIPWEQAKKALGI